MRSNLNRWFQEKRGINIITDTKFVKANMMFKGMLVKAKKAGKGIRKSTIPISDPDLRILGAYFDVDHVTTPNPRVLQKTVMFYIIYYLCRRGQENLLNMTKDYFSITVTPTGESYIQQSKDELDKNHREDDTGPANKGKVYEVPSKCRFHLDLQVINALPSKLKN